VNRQHFAIPGSDSIASKAFIHLIDSYRYPLGFRGSVANRQSGL
jgi:hypothetical protein